jgi:uncharacterized protein (TIGR00369 family)
MTENLKFGVFSRETLLSMDGLTCLQKMISGELPRVPMSKTLDFLLVEARPGEAVFEGAPDQRHYNPLGTVHGGYAATLLDSCMGCSVHSTLAKGEAYTTLEFKLNLVRPMNDRTGKVRAEGKIVHRGRTVATAEGKLIDAQGKVIAHATTTCMIFPASSA